MLLDSLQKVSLKPDHRVNWKLVKYCEVGMGKHRKLMTIKTEELSIEKIHIFKLLHEIKRVFNIVTL